VNRRVAGALRPIEQLAALDDDAIAEILDAMAETEMVSAVARWTDRAHDGQLPPMGDWRTWLMMAGRGFGKTRAGAEWVRGIAAAGDASTAIALVGATIGEVRAVMIEGPSGVLSVGPRSTRPVWEPSRGRLTWPTGAQAFVYSGENPEKLRGPQHGFAWCDELAKWGFPQATWDNLQLGLRVGERPRALVTTTPRPIRLLRAMLDDPAVVVTRGATAGNAALPEAYVAAMREAYEGTRWGRQELEGALIEDVEGALWTRDMIEGCRVVAAPALRRVVVGVDPPASAGGDACGIVVVGLGVDGFGYVIEDASVSGLSPEGWAGAVAAVSAKYGADRVIAEANNGGAMVESVLRAADTGLPVRLVHASRGKVARAEPVAALYGSGRMFHVGAWPDLEDELCGMVTGGAYEGPGRSPDRADAAVWAVTELMLRAKVVEPRVRVV
jgi:phage terminase large subunit-like protein